MSGVYRIERLLPEGSVTSAVVLRYRWSTREEVTDEVHALLNRGDTRYTAPHARYTATRIPEDQLVEHANALLDENARLREQLVNAEEEEGRTEADLYDCALAVGLERIPGNFEQRLEEFMAEVESVAEDPRRRAHRPLTEALAKLRDLA